MVRVLTRGALVLAVLLALSLPASGSRGAAGWPNQDLSWGNGLVVCNFTADRPTVSVSAEGVASSGVSVSLSSIEESAANGTPVAVASLDGLAWQPSNRSTADLYDLEDSVRAPIEKVGDPPAVGSVEVHVDYELPAYSDAPSTDLRDVTMEVRVSNWTWQLPGDRLVLELSVWPTFAGTERLSGSDSGQGITSTAIPSGPTREFFDASAEANTSGPVLGSSRTAVTSRMDIHDSGATVSLWIGGTAGEFSGLSYLATLGIPAAPSILGIPWYDYGLVMAGAAAASAGLAVVARKVRRRPSDLVFVEEER